MPLSSDQLVEYVGSGESLEAVYSATLTERSVRTPVSIGLTDQRLFYVSEEGWFGTIDYDSICTIRSRPEITRTYSLDDVRLAVGAGSFAALAGFVVAATSAATLLVPFLLLAAVCGLVTAEYLRRHADDIEMSGDDGLRERLDEFDLREALRRFREDITGRTDLYQLLLLGSGLLALSSFLAVAVVASSWQVVFGMLALVGGLGLVDYAYRHRAEFGGFDVVCHRETVVDISTDDNRTFSLRVASSDDLCKAVSRHAVGVSRNLETTTR